MGKEEEERVMDDTYGNYLFPSEKGEIPTVYQQSSSLRARTPQARNQQPEKKQGK